MGVFLYQSITSLHFHNPYGIHRISNTLVTLGFESLNGKNRLIVRSNDLMGFAKCSSLLGSESTRVYAEDFAALKQPRQREVSHRSPRNLRLQSYSPLDSGEKCFDVPRLVSYG